MEQRSEPSPEEPAATLAGPAPPPSANAFPRTPDSVGPYAILRELGRGGMGVVYLARDPRLERQVALKMLPRVLDSDPVARERFLGEARTLAALNHPNIATIHSLEESGGRHFLTMELVEGRPMSECLRGGALPLDETLALMRQVVRAVEAAHSIGVVHRDLKPSNLMLRDDGVIKVLDFGLAVRLQLESDTEEARAVVGTPGYMSPEQIRGEAANPRTDVWAVGCLFYEFLCGRPLIVGGTAGERFAATMALDASPALTRDLPERISLLVRRCLAASAEERPSSIREVRLAIEEEIADRALPRAAVPADAGLPGNLPRRVTSFVGRGRDLAESARLLSEHRLLTITGAGGCGKTRLSLELAHELRDAVPDGAWFLELGSLEDPAFVPASVAATLGVTPQPGTNPLDALRRSLEPKRALLVLDNCEHLVDACAHLAKRVLETCPHVRILATSRETLRVDGEAVYTLAPLALPGSGAEDSGAVRLFVDRAQAVLPGFELDAANRPAIHEICRRLDGIPLAIELAAARVKTLPVDKIRDLLDDRFRLLTRGSRTAQPHQATLRALIDWSYDRLDAQEQTVFRRLSVFRGAWTLDAVEAVVAGGDVEAWEALDLFTRLVEKSLIVRDDAPRNAGYSRYFMLESIRAYAREKLHASEEEERSALRRQRDYVVDLCAAGEVGLRGPEQASWSVRLADAAGDIRSVLERVAQEPDGAEAGLRIVGACGYWWVRYGLWEEAVAAITRALAHPSADRTSAPFGRALGAAGSLAWRMGEFDRARKSYQDALAVMSRVGTDAQVGSIYMNLGNVAFTTGDNDEAERFYETSLEYFRRANDRAWIAGCLTNLSVIALARDDIDKLEATQTEAVQIYESLGIRSGICTSLLQLGIAAFMRGDDDLSRAHFDRSRALALEIDDNWTVMAALANIAPLEVRRGRHADARAILFECLARLKDMRDPQVALPILESIASLRADAETARSAVILAAAGALRASLKMPLLSYEITAIRDLEARLVAALGESGWARARAEGELLSMEAALTAAEALLEAAPGN